MKKNSKSNSEWKFMNGHFFSGDTKSQKTQMSAMCRSYAAAIPSCRHVKKRNTANFDTLNNEVEFLLALSIVGIQKYNKTILIYRLVSKRMRDAIDVAIHMWCQKFNNLQEIQFEWANGLQTPLTKDEFSKISVEKEKLVFTAFGNGGRCATLSNISMFDRTAYIAASTNTCSICKTHLTRCKRKIAIEDAEANYRSYYTFSHSKCEKAHTVLLNHRPKSTDNESQIEMGAVLALIHGNEHDTEHSTDLIASMSSWFRFKQKNTQTKTIRIWLKPESHVNAQDTLYGRLRIKNSDVRSAMLMRKTHHKNLANAATLHKHNIQRHLRSISDKNKCELRIWLGKGKSIWRTLEELDCFHPDFVSSAHIDRLIDHRTRQLTDNVAKEDGIVTICNVILLFSQSIRMTRHGLTCEMVESTMCEKREFFLRPSYFFENDIFYMVHCWKHVCVYL